MKQSASLCETDFVGGGDDNVEEGRKLGEGEGAVACRCSEGISDKTMFKQRSEK
jgi:hypothetical protein